MDKLIASVNWKFVTHIVPSRFTEGQVVIFFTTGKYVVVAGEFSKIAQDFEKGVANA